MPNAALPIRLTVTPEDRPEGILMKDDNTWRSEPSGWLKVQSGKWIQNSLSGVALNSPAGEKIGYLHGLIFETAPIGDTGEFKNEATGGIGRWLVV